MGEIYKVHDSKNQRQTGRQEEKKQAQLNTVH
jgi:hypothetical protein